MDDIKRGHFSFMVPEQVGAPFDSATWTRIHTVGGNLNTGCVGDGRVGPNTGGIHTAGEHRDLVVILFGRDCLWNQMVSLVFGIDLFGPRRPGVVDLPPGSSNAPV
ncbi:MAG: hypothetical protein M1830_000073 [Pleopsidium flavum]|nr:MAG: hypothetical protein M1830_000073 [Pleopsidium flavum]